MTLRNKSKLFGWFAAATLLLTTSCKDDALTDLTGGGSDEVRVSFTLTPEALATTSRAAGDYVDYDNNHISDGSKADMLIYAVYDENDNLLEGYSSGIDPVLAGKGFDHGDGQTIMAIDRFPCTVNIILTRGQKYNIAFWAQNSNSKAYNTRDLRKVEVIYGELDSSQPDGIEDGDAPSEEERTKTTTPNNDETRDAFCRTVELTPGATGTIQQNVYLYRPLAQINVGTSGFDYEIVNRDALKKYRYSKIRINRVARYLDVVGDRIITNTTTNDDSKTPEAFAVVDFGYAPIPAYYKYDQSNPNGNTALPEYPSYTMWDWEYNQGFRPKDDVSKATYQDEEFLKVRLYNHEGETGYAPKDANKKYNEDIIDGFMGYSNYNNHLDEISETFKYLSMCYVLTSSTKEDPVVINNVKVWLATDANGSNEIEVLNIDHVPAQRNWRTNIVGNILTENVVFDVKLDQNFAGEFNGVGDNWSGALADGVYYNSTDDVIEISNANGLLWFQQMVNGRLTQRDFSDTKLIDQVTTTPYVYKTSDGVEKQLKYSAVNPDDATKALILKALKMKEWPKADNFHFTGVTVRLMADIDLAGIEWIPIGFDGRILEQIAFKYKESNPMNRGFFGTFDGNGHTIYNLSTKRFSAEVPERYEENVGLPSGNLSDKVFTTSRYRFVDNPQWFARGLFGMIGGNANIKNVRLQNVDIYGCQGVGGIVGVAYGDKIKIENCVVDGGSIIITPMYRGDTKDGSNKPKHRTFARGIYMGGIVGCFNTQGGEVNNCEVRNLYMQGFRRIGGIIGSLDLASNDASDVNTTYSTSKVNSIRNNQISNTVLVASQFSVFGEVPENKNANFPQQSGFGWGGTNYSLVAQPIVGGDSRDYVDKNPSVCSGNVASGLTFSEMKIWKDGSNPWTRYSIVQACPLEYMPPMSSWYADVINLTSNYYGEPSARRIYEQHKFQMLSNDAAKDGTMSAGGTQWYYPMKLPRLVGFDWVEGSGNVGLYVESVRLDGKDGIGGRSVLTPNNIQGNNDCAIYVTARDRYQFNHSNTSQYKASTVISNMVVRGAPWAYTGVLISPNRNMDKVELNNVAVYDVYKTIALDQVADYTDSKYWPNSSEFNATAAKLVVNNCNLRGYTIPGKGFSQVNYSTTTFEQGTFTNHGDREMTCKVHVPTTFTDCYFKAPYFIDLKDRGSNNVTFTNCYATSSSNTNVKITMKANCAIIKITSNAQGEPVVTYLDASGKEIK